MGVLKMWRGKGGMIKDLNLVTDFLWEKKRKKMKKMKAWITLIRVKSGIVTVILRYRGYL